MRQSVEAGASSEVVHTLIVSHSRHKNCEEQSPHAEAIEDGGNKTVGVQLCYEVGDLRICRGRYETRVDRHLELMQNFWRRNSEVGKKKIARVAKGETGGTAQICQLEGVDRRG